MATPSWSSGRGVVLGWPQLRWLDRPDGPGASWPCLSASPWRSVLLVGLLAVGGGLAMALVYGTGAGVNAGLFAIVAGGPVLIVAHRVVRYPDRFGSLTRQLAICLLMAIGVGVEVIALVPITSGPDPFTLALLLVFIGTLVGYSAWLVTSRISHDVVALRDSVVALAAGARSEQLGMSSKDEVTQLAATTRHFFGELERCEAERRQLLVAVSHDLRTPLSCLELLIEAVTDGLLDVEGDPETIERMSFHVKSLRTLIDDLFTFSRIEAGDTEWPVERTAVDELVLEVLDGMRGRASRKGVRLTTRGLQPVPVAMTNPAKAQRVLFNLVENAIRHTPPGGEIQVAARASAGRVTIEVADSGAGIDPEERERIFEPFWRGGAEPSPREDGAGLGLAICRAIVQALGGRIWVEPSDGGAKIRFTLSRASQVSGNT